jgi:hypothetical protein
MRTTFFTCVNKKYEDFIPLFIHSILYHNENADIEIGVESTSLSHKMKESIDFIKNKYSNNKIVIREVNFGRYNIDGKFYNIIPNSVRFIETPSIINEYVYIGDIDIVTLQNDVSVIHIEDMRQTGLNYSNIVRPYDNNKMKRLSGLHFTKWESYYPVPNYNNLAKEGLLNHDEVLLYRLVTMKNDVSESHLFRPVHGIHMSPNRKSDAKLGWGLGKWKNEWLSYRESNEFQYLKKNYFSKRILENLDIIDKYYNLNVPNS